MTPKRTKKKIEIEPDQEELIPDSGFYDTDEEVVPDEDAPAVEEADPGHTMSVEEKCAELNDRYLRLYSEFDNYRKRTLKEKIDLTKTASSEVITDLLPVLDDFERAIQAFSDTPDTDQALKDGVILIYNKFLNALTQKGLGHMKTIGEPFDTDFHEAITNIPAPTPDMKGKVVDEVEKGYLLNGKVIRYAKVVVGS
ncbi:MAG: nucleotide exchange factor GrpE [Bacteroidales bacterium]|nr:nucleotide exchange factor GrpE [Bacteroidota bacterium]MBL6950814.1 nucleotide exchange factor GrpE [Bacteroidales bacterium]